MNKKCILFFGVLKSMFVKYKSFTIQSMDSAKGKMFAPKYILKYFGEKGLEEKNLCFVNKII